MMRFMTRAEPNLRRNSILVSICFALSCAPFAAADDLGRFDRARDLFLPQFDCKTDVDDLHSVAAVATMLRDERFEGVDFHAVAGAYGRQEGLYVPAPALFEMAFGENWSDAHNERGKALVSVIERVAAVLGAGGSVWVAEAGQSDFTADWLAEVAQRMPEIDMRQRVHVVQHSDWNEESANPEKLAFVKRSSSYHKIPDGNATDNGTPGFKSESPTHWRRAISAKLPGCSMCRMTSPRGQSIIQSAQ